MVVYMTFVDFFFLTLLLVLMTLKLTNAEIIIHILLSIIKYTFFVIWVIFVPKFLCLLFRSIFGSKAIHILSSHIEHRRHKFCFSTHYPLLIRIKHCFINHFIFYLNFHSLYIIYCSLLSVKSFRIVKNSEIPIKNYRYTFNYNRN